uniref:Uncharacterized protein n=1 Tax=Oryza brachyantha TaxID=4533 RepID=J3N2A5_ORYBR
MMHRSNPRVVFAVHAGLSCSSYFTRAKRYDNRSRWRVHTLASTSKLVTPLWHVEKHTRNTV